MCIICYKPRGVTAPSKKTVKTMYYNNPDGAGLMYLDGGAVHIIKGLMTFGEFYAEYQKVRDIDAPMIFHFRIATDGGISRGMCQPFPVESASERLTATECITQCGVAHNGIISMCRGLKTVSDTAEYSRRFLTLIRDKIGFTADALDLIEASIDGSRLAIMDADADDVYLLGTWKKDGGLYYSNDTYKARARVKTSAKTARSVSTISDALTAWSDYTRGRYSPYWYCDGVCSECRYTLDCYGPEGYISNNESESGTMG